MKRVTDVLGLHVGVCERTRIHIWIRVQVNMQDQLRKRIRDRVWGRVWVRVLEVT